MNAEGPVLGLAAWLARSDAVDNITWVSPHRSEIEMRLSLIVIAWVKTCPIGLPNIAMPDPDHMRATAGPAIRSMNAMGIQRNFKLSGADRPIEDNEKRSRASKC